MTKKLASKKASPAKKSAAPKALSTYCTLETANTMMGFAQDNGRWRLIHYGARIACAADVRPTFNRHSEGTNTGNGQGDTYSAFGANRQMNAGDEICGDMQKMAALEARHTDGNGSVCWKDTVAHFVPDVRGTKHLVFEMSDTTHPFHARQHFRAMIAEDVIETWVEIWHEEDGPVSLARMDSLGLELPSLAEHYHVLSLSGQWACEANLSEAELVRGQRIVLGARSGVRGAWENNPALMVSIGPRATEDSGTVIAGALAWSGAWEISAMHAFANHELRIFAGAANISGPYVLDAGKMLTLPKFVLTYSDAGKGAASRALHRWARNWRMPHGRELRSVLLNSWEGAYFNFSEKTLTDMMDGVRDMGGELFVIDDGWFGRGKFARNDDKVGLGDWVWNKEKLPRGLAYLVREAAKRGLALGLWFEPEMANTTSDLVTKHPDWVMQEAGRPLRQGRGGTQVVLDLCNPAVRDEIFRQIDKVIRDAKGLRYIKWDANADFMNPGSLYLDKDHQANIWFDYTVGAFELFDRLRKAHPDIVFQACSSGGGHCDFGWLGRADEFWGSDNSCAQQRVFIQWGESMFYPANACAAHVTVVPNHQTHRDAPLKFRFDVAMTGRLGFELHPKNLTPEEVEFAKKAVANYKRIRPVVQQGDLYRLVSPYDGSEVSAMLYVAADRRKAVLFALGRERLVNQGACPVLRLPGLDPNLRYRVQEINQAEDWSHIWGLNNAVVGGDALAAIGVGYGLKTENDSMVVEFTAE